MPEDVEAIKNVKSERAVDVTIYVNLLTTAALIKGTEKGFCGRISWWMRSHLPVAPRKTESL